MTTLINTYAKGRFAELCRQAKLGNGDLLIIPIQTTGLPSDTVLRTAANLQAIWAAGGLEATFTNYNPAARKIVAPADITITPNLSSPFQQTVSFVAQSWPAAGGALNNNLSRIAAVYRATPLTPDSQIDVVATYDYIGSTNGGPLNVALQPLTAN